MPPLKTTIHSLTNLREIPLGCNRCYLASLSNLDDPNAGERDLQHLTQPALGADPSVKGLNVFDTTKQSLLRTLQLGKFNIHGWRRGDLLVHLQISPSGMFRQILHLHALGLIKKAAHSIPISIAPRVWAEG